MSEAQSAATIDLIRWTFTANAENAAAIEEHLGDLGLDVLVREGVHFVVLWDEPEGNVDEVIEAIWETNGEPLEITHEEFHRTNLLQVNLDDSADAEQAA